MSVRLLVQRGVASCVVGGATTCRGHVPPRDVTASSSGAATFAARPASDTSTCTPANSWRHLAIETEQSACCIILINSRNLFSDYQDRSTDEQSRSLVDSDVLNESSVSTSDYTSTINQTLK